MTAGSFDELHCVLAVGEIGNRYMHAVFGEPFGERLPDAAGTAGDDGDFVFVAFGHLNFSLKWRPRHKLRLSPRGLDPRSMMRCDER